MTAEEYLAQRLVGKEVVVGEIARQYGNMRAAEERERIEALMDKYAPCERCTETMQDTELCSVCRIHREMFSLPSVLCLNTSDTGADRS
jgi:hypothetical protein